MSKGTVKWLSKKKGYGFLIRDDGKEFFVHVSEVKDEIASGDSVEFDLAQSNGRGPKAVNVRWLGK